LLGFFAYDLLSDSTPTTDSDNPKIRYIRKSKPHKETTLSKIYLGWDTHLDIPIVIKSMNLDSGLDPDFILAATRREAQIPAQLGFPGLPQIYDLIDCRGELSIVMEYLPPEKNLSTIISMLNKSGRFEGMTGLETVRVIDGISKTIDRLFAEGWTHGDIKPENIFATEPIKLIDFGNIHRNGESFSSLSPLYSPPEKMYSIEGPGVSSEVYSLGLVTYVMLFPGYFGCLYFSPEGRKEKITSVYENGVIHSVLALPRIEGWSDEQMGRLSNVFANALRTNPKERYRSAGEFAIALQKAFEGVPMDKPIKAMDPSKKGNIVETKLY
jgi:serine/threonine protein kinase